MCLSTVGTLVWSIKKTKKSYIAKIVKKTENSPILIGLIIKLIGYYLIIL